MLPRLDPANSLPVSAVSPAKSLATVADPRQDGAIKLDQIAIGKTLQGQVVAKFPDGTSLVRLQNNTQPSGSTELKMLLPGGFELGAALKLTVLTSGAQPTFSASLQNASSTVALSAAALAMDQLLTSDGQETRPTKVAGTTPLLASATTDPQALATQLQKTVGQSGVFYEAHLRQWADGERSLVQIRQEPQNQSKAGAVAGAVVPVDKDSAVAGAVVTVDKDRATVTAQQLLPAQLDALENRRFAWEGELWPGQPLQFEISEDKHESNAKQQASPDGAWQTVVRFQLPHLGQVNATISLQGEHVQVHVDVQNEAAASLLKTAGEQLTLSLSASGTALDKLTVQDLAAS